MFNPTITHQDTWTPSPSVPTSTPEPSLAFALPIIVRYRYHSQGQLFSQTFSPDQTGRTCFADFIDSIRAKAVQETYTTPSGSKSTRWVLVDRGLVDWMSICFVDPAIEAAKQAKRQNALDAMRKWKEGAI